MPTRPPRRPRPLAPSPPDAAPDAPTADVVPPPVASSALTIRAYYDALLEERDRVVAPYNHQLDALLLVINSGHGDLPLHLPLPESMDAP